VAKKKKSKKKSTRAPAKANRSKKKSSKRNGGVSLATVKRLMGGKKKKKNGRRSKGNPFGISSRDAIGNSVAVLSAVTAAKLIPPIFPASWTATDMGRFFTTLGVAAGEVALAHFLFPQYRTMVLAGAGAQTLSIALNPILRKVSSNITLGRIAQARSMGQLRDFVPGNFPEPYNPIYNRMLQAGMATSPGAVGAGASVGRYRGRFGGR